MIVPYTGLPDELGGPRPLLDVRVGDMEEVEFPCLVDSGSSHTLLPRVLASAAGVDLRSTSPRRLAVGGHATTALFTTVHLATEALEWDADVGFCEPWTASWGLLGHHSFFRWFTVTFRAADYEFELEPVEA